MICVGYSKRASCDPNLELMPLKVQNDQIREYVTGRGWKLSCFYEDKSDSPEADNGFQKLREAGLRREFDVVVFLSVYRFGANVSYARELLLNAFYKAGIHFVILEDDIDSLTMSYDELYDYFTSVRQRLNSVIGKYNGKARMIETNQISEFKISYGYKLADDKTEIVVDEEAAFVIRKIFEMYDDDKSTNDICDYLNKEGFDIPSYRIYKLYPQRGKTGNNRWSSSVINRIKKNRMYIGCDIELDYRTVSYPEIVPVELFERVNEKVKGKSRGKTINPRIENPFGPVHYLSLNTILKFKSCSAAKDYPYFHVVNDRDTIITLAELESAVRKRLAEEKEKCERVMMHLKSGDAGEVMTALDEEYSAAIKEIADEFEACAIERINLFSEYEAGHIDKPTYDQKNADLSVWGSEINQKLLDKTADIDARKKLISPENPWLKRYMSYTPELVFTRKISKSLFDQITIGVDGAVDIKLFNEEASVFPMEWRVI